jgi:hypothetical protein
MLRMLACPPPVSGAVSGRPQTTHGWGSRLRGCLRGSNKLIRGDRLAASTMDKSDLVILWRGQSKHTFSTGANPEQCASGWWGLSFGGKKSVKDLTPHPARPDSFSPSLRPRWFTLRMPLGFASGAFRIWQVSAGCPQPFPHTQSCRTRVGPVLTFRSSILSASLILSC